MAAVCLGMFAVGLAVLPGLATADSAACPEPRKQHARAAEGLPELTRLAQTALPAVVGILTTEEDRPGPLDGDAREYLLDRSRGGGPRHGLASGFIIDPQGFILTNAHVVAGASRIQVELGDDDEERLPARVVGRDEPTDVALLKIDAGRELATLPLGNSDQLQVAEWVMVMSNPFGLTHSVTVGVISHTGRVDIVPQGHDPFPEFIQTDAPINPGSSGGPLVNLHGEVVGIATAINVIGQGIGFAVPINMAKGILQQLRDHGRVVRSWMGVSVRDLGRTALEAGLRLVVVTGVVAGSPGAVSGLRVGDVITGFDGRRVASAARLRWYVSTAGVGRSVSLTVRRSGSERSVRVELAELPRSSDADGAQGDSMQGVGSGQ
jgi:S1-C subfamily serine protease